MIDPNKIAIRPVGLSDIDWILEWENNPENWTISENDGRYSREDILHFVTDQLAKTDPSQIRFVIDFDGTPVGTVDLYEIDSQRELAYVGILVASKNHRNQGLATRALNLLISLSTESMKIKLLKARIHDQNKESKALFEKVGFAKNEEEKGESLEKGDYIQWYSYEKWLRK